MTATGQVVSVAVSGRSDAAIIPLRRDQLGSVGDVFASSHAEYPAFRHLVPDPDRRSAVLRAFFTATVRDALPFAAVDAAVNDGELLGVAVWLPPGGFPWSLRRKLRSTPAMLAVLRAAPRSFRNFMRLGANAERLHPRYPHWNLETLGIRQDAQGGGLGTRLMAPGLARADGQGMSCYLTTARAENVGFYERFGFEVENAALPLVPGGPTHWGMRRAPRYE